MIKFPSRPQIPKGPLCTGCSRISEKRCCPSAIATTTHALFISEQPDEVSAELNYPFADHGGKIVTTAVKALQYSYPKLCNTTCAYAYLVQCKSPTDTAATKAEIDRCHVSLDSYIAATNPKVIVALGAAVTRQLGIKTKHTDARGKFFTHFRYKAPVLVTFSEKALLANPGLFEAFKRDILNGLEKSIEIAPKKLTLEEITKDYHLPTTVSEAVDVCNTILEYKSDTWALSVDLETTSLYPEKPDSKIIAFCFAWDVGKATTILYDHPYLSPEYLAQLPTLKEAIARVLASPKPKIFHHGKFDLKFLTFKYGFEVNNVVWDTLGGEHLLDEDKKGNYGLKVLTAGWFPQFAGYEDRLYDLLLKDASSQTELLHKEIRSIELSTQGESFEYLTELRQYQKQMAEYDRAQSQYLQDAEHYQHKQDDYLFCKSHLAGLNAAWTQEVTAWPKGKRGKPKKPKKWFSKPNKPTAPRKPTRPKDPRTKKERQISEDAGFETVPVHDLQVYGAIDADLTRRIAKLQKERIATEKSNVSKLMRSHFVPASTMLGQAEYEGTKIDREYLEVLDHGLRVIVANTETELLQMTRNSAPKNITLNLNNPAMLGNVLFSWGWQDLDGTPRSPYEIQDYTKKGQASTSSKSLIPLIKYVDEKKNVPTPESYFLERVFRYRKASKALNTFLANVRVLSKRDGFLHTQFHLNGTGTGRLSSTDMNIQNIPHTLAGWNIKKLFIPDSEEYVIVNVDYKGAEVRVFTAYAADTNLIKALNEGLDMHSFFAHKVFGRPYEDYVKRDDKCALLDAAYRNTLDTQRSLIKRVVFGILYGAGPYKIAETVGVPFDEAKALIKLLYQMFPAIQQYAVNIETEVQLRKYVETHFHRRRRFPLADISRHQSRAFRQARNFKIQSTSSDIVIAQMIEMSEPLRKQYGGRMLLTVHDSIVFQWPKKYLSELKEFVLYFAENRVKEKYTWLPVPFETEIKVGPSYGECQDLSDYLAAHPYTEKTEGIVEENELLNELREDAFTFPSSQQNPNL